MTSQSTLRREPRLIIRDIYDLIPSEAGSKNKRFKLSSISGVKRFSQVTDHFLWLSEAGVALPVYNVTAPVARPSIGGSSEISLSCFTWTLECLCRRIPKRLPKAFLMGEAEDAFGMNMGAAF